MADERQHNVKETKGLRSQLKKAFGIGSQHMPQSRSNSPTSLVAAPVFTAPVSPPPSSLPLPAMAIDLKEAAKLRAKYTHFRILVIGRANAGKTTLLKRVCNTTEEPSIYNEDKNLLKPTSKRGEHNIRHSFTFKSNPGFIFHDSPGFEAGGEEELKDVMTFIQQCSKAKNVDDQIHVIWFCFDPDVSRPLLPLEKKFFNEDRAWNVPIVAIFMKFDDLITQVLDRKKKPEENMNKALEILEIEFKQPLSSYKYQPCAYVHFKAIHKDESNHQEQVGKLIKQTAASIDNLALKMLFVTVQRNNLEVCIEYAVNEYIFESTETIVDLIFKAASWFGHCYQKYVGVMIRDLDNFLISNFKGK
ncbi:hypothetical protein GALMADRAFT_267622 [Galerina marginata CBS 339.88]|uniref:G domain-containing protein n=1 Tax=Galerina marginata (strain CBS 339.88) TaxID=685588 RepID=A0A067TC58_GALM3|nr:hypothetical protein GALMADRAFT_267622 [Galerina marginata CBS 339.88]